MALLSPYERKARLIPGILGVAPVTIVIATLGLKQFPAATVALALLSATGGTYLLSTLVANFGRRAQKDLWEKWQGRPTTHLLRMREPVENPVQREIWRKALVRRTKVRLLSGNREAADPMTADHTIEAAVGQVLSLGQDDRFPILVSENSQYGLERNLYGFRWVGRTIAAACIIGLLVVSFLTDWSTLEAIAAGIVINTLILGAWIFLPSDQRVKDAGFRYATQLMHAVVRAETLSEQDVNVQTNLGDDS